jgi:hypothetical protein
MKNPKTGRSVVKPVPPAMLKVVKGVWNYGEVPSKSEESHSESESK